MTSGRPNAVMDFSFTGGSAGNFLLRNFSPENEIHLAKPSIPIHPEGKEAEIDNHAPHILPSGVHHIPVLLKEILTFLQVKRDGTYVDCTVGEGGHAEAILEKLGEEGFLLGLDKDEKSLASARQRLKNFGSRFRLVKEDFRKLPLRLEQIGISKVDGVLLDLGFSSYQLQDYSRGFSFREEGPLDMRMDASSPLKAQEIVNSFSYQDLRRILIEYGEERRASSIARIIVKEREKREITSTLDLASLVARAVCLSVSRRSGRKRSRIHPATHTFQALRIAVNQELETLQEILHKAPSLLKPTGRICVISYHSLEDRIVKRAFLAAEGTLRIITRKPVTPSREEIESNRRSRSAKLRVAEGVGS